MGGERTKPSTLTLEPRSYLLGLGAVIAVDREALNQQYSIPREKEYLIFTTKITIILLLHQFLNNTPTYQSSPGLD